MTPDKPERVMTQQYSSFLIRCWSLDGGQHRIRIEHIQSGASTQVSTLIAALTWLNTHAHDPPDETADGLLNDHLPDERPS
jgi:hypothetical protein